MDNFFPSELISLLNKNTRGRIELGRIDLMQKFSFFEVEEKEANNVMKALNRTNWNGRKVSVEIAGDEGKNVPKGRRTGTAGSYGKKDSDGKKRSNKEDVANGTMLPADVETEPKTLQTTRRKASPAAKNAVIPRPVAKKTIGNSSFKAITNLKIQNRTSAKKAGQNGHRKRNKQTT